MGIGKKSIFSPFAFWANLFKKPTTIRYPDEDLDVFDKAGPSPYYRGLHANDIEMCIGCGTCEEICPTAAISMIDGENVGEGKLGKRPRIDYGRCCFCAFCVDVCPSSSLSMSRDYIHSFVTPLDKVGDDEMKAIQADFTQTPGETHRDNPGYITPDALSWLDRTRVSMRHESAKARGDSFLEIVKGFSKEEALKEASRCVECGVCTETCPANMKIPEYIKAIWEDDLEGSVAAIYEDNPLPNVCGRVCTHKCETVCAIGHRGEPIAIRWLKRYAVDALEHEEVKAIAARAIAEPVKKKIAIIGAGPAGLSAAYYLALMGYTVTMYEANAKAGGVMRYGIPNYRLPLDALDKDIETIRSLGVTIKTNMPVGKKISLGQVKRSPDAVILATGFPVGASTRIAGIDKKGYRAMDLLSKIMDGKKVPIEKEIIVIGGGNVAFDIARSYARLQKQKYGAVNITLTCLEDKNGMLADAEELQEGQEEGLRVMFSRSPREIVMKGKRVAGLKTARCVSIFDTDGRFNPQIDERDSKVTKGSMIIEAIGQRPDYSLLGAYEKDLAFVRGRVLTTQYGKTDLPWLFAAGDIVHGPDIIHGIADGHTAALGVDKALATKKQTKRNPRGSTRSTKR